MTGNAVTLIGAVVVYLLAIGEVKGFAFTMGLTTAFDLVVSFLVMAPLMQLIASKPAWAKPAFNGLGGIFNLVEERREQGFYAKPAKKSASTETAATPAAKNPATPATPDTAEKEN